MGNGDDRILVRHDTMDAGREALINGFKQLQTQLDNMESELKREITEWTGDAEAAFLYVKKAWHEVFDSMGLALTTHADLVQNTKDGFIYADGVGERAFNGIDI